MKNFVATLILILSLSLLTACDMTKNVFSTDSPETTMTPTETETAEITETAEMTTETETEPDFDELPIFVDGVETSETTIVWHNSDAVIDSEIVEKYIPVALEWKEQNCHRMFRGRSEKLSIHASSAEVLGEVLDYIVQHHADNLSVWRETRSVNGYEPATVFLLILFPNCPE